MDLEHFFRQIKEMNKHVAEIRPGQSNGHDHSRDSWMQSAAALDTAMEELRVAEEELRAQNEEVEASRFAIEAERQRYHDLFEFAPDGYLVTDLHGLIVEANRAAAGLLGDPPKFLTGKPLANYVIPDQRWSFRSELLRLPKIKQAEKKK